MPKCKWAQAAVTTVSSSMVVTLNDSPLADGLQTTSSDTKSPFSSQTVSSDEPEATEDPAEDRNWLYTGAPDNGNPTRTPRILAL